MENTSSFPFPEDTVNQPKVVKPLGPDPRPSFAGIPGPAPESPGGFAIGDVYYTLFRHKWKIIICAVVGFAAAAAAFFLIPAPYVSEAKLFIRYVMESQGVGPATDDMRMKSPDQRGETIINSELEILTSLDLAEQVARAYGPEKILATGEGGNDPIEAAFVVRNNFAVDVAAKSSVLRLVFKHPDPQIVQPVLREYITRYLQRHVDVHRTVGIVGDFLSQETDKLRSRLTQTEEELRRLRNQAGVISVAESKKAYMDQIGRLREEILQSEAELAEKISVYKQYAPDAAAKKENPEAPAPAAPATLSPDTLNMYQNLLARQDILRKRVMELQAQFTPENVRVKEAVAQLKEVEGNRNALETANPALVRTAPAAAASSAVASTGAYDLQAEGARITALQAKIKVLTGQLETVRTEASNLDRLEVAILELERRRELEAANYKTYSASLEKSRIDEALGSGSVSNISQVQTPTPPIRDRKKTLQICAGLAVGGLALGLGWAFLVEFYLDHTVRRPTQIERNLHVPLFLSIPHLKSQNRLALPAPKDGETAAEASADSQLALQPFHETLRDRLISYFESKGLTHKPKLVAVTGLGRDSGVTTTAAGLARSLSETGEGNVLLVDMTVGQGSAQHFIAGKEAIGIDEVLERRKNAQIEDNLYVVGEEPTTEKLGRLMPQRFNKIVPKLKASDFDYIIFDMPPVSQISVTPRLAGFMDMVLLVLESEKTDQELVKRATALLAESKAHVGAVLNKSRNYVPSSLHQDDLGNA